jgi:hypothetical protein
MSGSMSGDWKRSLTATAPVLDSTRVLAGGRFELYSAYPIQGTFAWPSCYRAAAISACTVAANGVLRSIVVAPSTPGGCNRA